MTKRLLATIIVFSFLVMVNVMCKGKEPQINKKPPTVLSTLGASENVLNISIGNQNTKKIDAVFTVIIDSVEIAKAVIKGGRLHWRENFTLPIDSLKHTLKANVSINNSMYRSVKEFQVSDTLWCKIDIYEDNELSVIFQDHQILID